MQLTVTSSPDEELITLEDAKRHLRVISDSLDDEVTEKLRAARGWCESYVSRTLRSSVTRTLSMRDWWCGKLDLPYPPALSVTSVKYWVDGVDTTLDSANYRLLASSDGVARIEWTDSASLPGVDSRADAIRVAYTAGYVELPPTAKVAILMALSMFWGDAKGADLGAAERAAKALLNACDWGCYR